MAYRYQVEVSPKLITTLLWIVLLGTGFAIALLSFAFRGNRDHVICILNGDSLDKLILSAKKKKTVILWGTIVIFTLVYISLIFNDNIWTDEAYTIDLLRNCHTVKEVFAFTAQDVHPPLYYVILLPFSNLFGINLQLFKILSIIPMILTFIVGAVFIRRRFNCRTALLFVFFLGTMPVTMEYAVQVRMYSWALLFVTVCALAAYDAYITGKTQYYVIAGFAGTACAYTHYFAFASALWIYGFLFLALLLTQGKRKNLLKWLGMSLGSAVLYLPWIPSMYKQVSGVTGSYWISAVTKKVVISYLGAFFDTDLPYVKLLLQILSVVMILVMLFYLIKSIQKKQREEISKSVFVFLCMAVLFCTVATGVILSRAIRPIFIIRYAVPCMGMLSLFFAYAVSRVKDKTYLLIIIFCFSLGVIDYEDTHAQEYESTTVPQMEAFFEENLSEGDIVAYNYKTFDFIYQYYFEADQLKYVEDIDFGSDYNAIWYLDTSYNPEITNEQIEQYGLNIDFVGNYNIEHNAFALYRISR